MRRDFSWRTAAKRYTEQYENLLQSPMPKLRPMP